MKAKAKKIIFLILSLMVCVLFSIILLVYTRPMEDVSLNLSLLDQGEGEVHSPEDFDDKGWVVFVQDEAMVTELEPDRLGGYLGLDPGQTFYFSRILAEEMDSPTLQIGAADRKFSVFLDDKLIYTDCPELDNRIGYIKLPMNDWDRTEPIILSLPLDYQGKTLTIAQSSPEFSETGAPKVWPADVHLYCGYSYESELIAESFQTAILAAFIFAVGVFLLVMSVRNEDIGTLCIAIAAFLYMAFILVDTSFFYTYFGDAWGRFAALIPMFITGSLLIFLCSKAGTYKKMLWLLTGIYFLALLTALGIRIKYSFVPAGKLAFFYSSFPEWIASIVFIVTLILGILFWRKENHFYQLCAPLALAAILVYWTALFLTDNLFIEQLSMCLEGNISYIYYKLLPGMTAAALISAVIDTVRTELERRMEKRLVEERQELTLANYENLRRQHEEVMMLRHDMKKHFHILQEMSNEEQTKAYLSDLIGQNDKIRPVIQSGNEMLDIILNSRLGAAIDAGIRVAIEKTSVPEKLPLSDADLCSLILNIIDNAITAATSSEEKEPYIQIKVQIKNNFFALACENTADSKQINKEKNNHKHPSKYTLLQKETMPKHGLGLKIIGEITERYKGTIDTEFGENYYKIKVAIPLS